jgi:hypothetical protein
VTAACWEDAGQEDVEGGCNLDSGVQELCLSYVKTWSPIVLAVMADTTARSWLHFCQEAGGFQRPLQMRCLVDVLEGDHIVRRSFLLVASRNLPS